MKPNILLLLVALACSGCGKGDDAAGKYIQAPPSHAESGTTTTPDSSAKRFVPRMPREGDDYKIGAQDIFNQFIADEGSGSGIESITVTNATVTFTSTVVSGFIFSGQARVKLVGQPEFTAFFRQGIQGRSEGGDRLLYDYTVATSSGTDAYANGLDTWTKQFNDEGTEQNHAIQRQLLISALIDDAAGRPDSAKLGDWLKANQQAWDKRNIIDSDNTVWYFGIL